MFYIRAYNILNELIIQKRKLELELNKNQQIKVKAENEKETLSGKISKLQESINSYSDISKLKAQVETKLTKTKKQADKVKQEVSEINVANEAVVSEKMDIQLQLERNAFFGEVRQLEATLRQLLKVNETLKWNDNSEMMGQLKSMVIENTKKYNQNLIGF